MSDLLVFCPADRILVIQRQGKIFFRGPGWVPLVPLVEKKQAEVITVRYMLPLLDVIEFDLEDKARVFLKNPAISIQLKEGVKAMDPTQPFKVAGPGFEDQIRQHAVNALGILNEWDSEDVRKMRGKGAKKNIEKHILKNKPLNDFLESLGFELKGFVIADFDYTAPVMEMRKKVYQAEMRSGMAEIEVGISEFESISKARELIGPLMHSLALSTGKSLEDVRKMVAGDKDLQKQIVGMYQDFKQRELTNVIDIRNNSQDGTGGSLIPLIAMLTGTLKGEKEVVEPKEKKEDSKKRPSKEELKKRLDDIYK